MIEALKVMDLVIDDSKVAKESIVGTNISLGNFCLQDILKKGLPFYCQQNGLEAKGMHYETRSLKAMKLIIEDGDVISLCTTILGHEQYKSDHFSTL